MEIWAEIAVVGNELLAGDVLDTNSNWLCRQLTGLGGRVRRVCMIRDELDAVTACVRDALSRETQLVITTGGLGPTEDDLTLQGVAGAVGAELVVHPRALEMVQAKYNELARQGYVADAEMTPSRIKMARFPQGAEPLQNNVGAAPGMLLRTGNCQAKECIIVSLPGVPDELEDIFQGALQPVLRELLGESYFTQWRSIVNCGDESVLAPLLGATTAVHPKVYVKSRARRFGGDVRFTITLSARGDSRAEVEGLLEAAWKDLQARLDEQRISVFMLDKSSRNVSLSV